MDRLAVSPDARARIVDAVEIGYREASEVIFETAPRDGERTERLRFSHRFECKNDGTRYEEPEPRLFSFNNPYGACPRCQGFGNTIDFDLDLVIPDKGKTLNEGAIEPWTKPKYRPLFTELKRFARQAEIPLDVPWFELDVEHQKVIINGEGRFGGVRGFFQHLERKKYKLHVRVFLSRYRGYSLCSTCGGTRLRPDARQVKIDGKDICQVCSMTVQEAAAFFDQLKLSPQQTAIAGNPATEIQRTSAFLERSRARISDARPPGLHALRWRSAAYSAGDFAGIAAGGHTATCWMSHPSACTAGTPSGWSKSSTDLRDLGNTILVVEHDPDIMRAADHILDLGPGAGENGGKVIGAGSIDEIAKPPHSLTGRYLANELHIQTLAPAPTGQAENSTSSVHVPTISKILTSKFRSG